MFLVATCIFAHPGVGASLDDGARFAFVVSPSEKRVYAFDLKKQEVASQIDLHERPHEIVASEALKALVVSHLTARSLTLIDLSDNDLRQIEYALDMVPNDIVASPLGDSVAIYDRAKRRLEVHALKRRAVILAADGVTTGSAFTFSPDGSTLYWPDSTTGTLHSIDLWSKQMELRLAEPGQELSALSRSADGLLGFVSGTGSSELFVIDLRSFSLLATLNVPPAPGRPWGTADGRYMFVAGSNTVTAISTDTLRLAYSLHLDDTPQSIHSGWLDTVAAITGESGSVVFIDVNSGKTLASHQFSHRPLEAIVTSDSKTMAVPLSGKGAIAFLNMREQSVANILDGLPSDIGKASIAISNNLCH